MSGFLEARENVELGLALRGVDPEDACNRGADALARVFAARTPVVIADEPTSRLDASTTLEIGALLAELAHDTGTTVVCATHDPLLIGLADREVRLGETVPLASLR